MCFACYDLAADLIQTAGLSALEFHQPRPNQMDAYLGDDRVGRVLWAGDDAPEGVHPYQVQHIDVHPDHLRKGIATALFNHVQQNVEPRLRHSDQLSESGAAFAQSMGHTAAGPQKIYRGINVNPWSGGDTGEALQGIVAPHTVGTFQRSIDPSKLNHPDLAPALLNHAQNGSWSEWGNFRGKAPNLGRHWTTDKRIAQGYGGDGGITTVIEADHPGEAGLDPKNTGVRGRGDRSNYGREQEVTLKPGTNLNVTHVHVRHPSGWHTHEVGNTHLARRSNL